MLSVLSPFARTSFVVFRALTCTTFHARMVWSLVSHSPDWLRRYINSKPDKLDFARTRTHAAAHRQARALFAAGRNATERREPRSTRSFSLFLSFRLLGLASWRDSRTFREAITENMTHKIASEHNCVWPTAHHHHKHAICRPFIASLSSRLRVARLPQRSNERKQSIAARPFSSWRLSPSCAIRLTAAAVAVAVAVAAATDAC
jgi:hypothetical protein